MKEFDRLLELDIRKIYSVPTFLQPTVNKIRAEKMGQTQDEDILKRNEGTQEKNDKDKKNIKRNDLKMLRKSGKINISYAAKYDEYLLKEEGNMFHSKVYKRKDIPTMNKEEMAEILEKPIEDLAGLDTYIYTLLHRDDKNYETNNLKMYYAAYRNLHEIPQVGEQLEKYIKIKYDLKGLYNKNKDNEYSFTPEERKEMLNIANTLKAKGLAKVKKGAKVIIRENIDKIREKVVQLKLKNAKKTNLEVIKQVTTNAQKQKIKTIKLIDEDRKANTKKQEWEINSNIKMNPVLARQTKKQPSLNKEEFRRALDEMCKN